MIRNLLVGLILLAAAPNVSVANAASEKTEAYAEQKVVYHNNGRGKDSDTYFKAVLKNLRNHVDAVGRGRVDIKVVNHGDGVRLFQLAQNDEVLASSLDRLRKDGVRFLVCKNTLEERKIDWRTLHGVNESDVVPSGIAELIRLQQQDYIYVHP